MQPAAPRDACTSPQGPVAGRLTWARGQALGKRGTERAGDQSRRGWPSRGLAGQAAPSARASPHPPVSSFAIVIDNRMRWHHWLPRTGSPGLGVAGGAWRGLTPQATTGLPLSGTLDEGEGHSHRAFEGDGSLRQPWGLGRGTGATCY